MNEKIKVLVFPANAPELHDALSCCVNIEVWGGFSKEVGSSYYYKNLIPQLPMCNEPNFISELNQAIANFHIDIIIPSHDNISLFFAEHRNQISAKVLVPDIFTARICRDKKLTYDLFSDCDFTPRIYKQDEIQYPAFLKPTEGQGGKGAKCIYSKNDLPENLSEYVISEFLPGEEWTVDCFTDNHHILRVISPRSRNRILGGICVDGTIEALTSEIKKIAEIINNRLHFLGLWYFQVKKDSNGRFKLMEISARCAGTMCLTRARGINLPLLSIYVALGKDVEIIANPYNVSMSRELFARFKIDYEWDTVYFDFDDTLIIDNKVNLMAISFLYYCKNTNKKVTLLTKHIKRMTESMEKYAIDKLLFSEIIQIGIDDKKSKYINKEKAVFIDNAFQERQDVFSVHHIPVFDVDNIAVLIDWRN